jgi:hypothetical protein
VMRREDLLPPVAQRGFFELRGPGLSARKSEQT